MENIDIEKLKSYITDLEEQITPLTKKTPVKPKPNVIQDENKMIIEEEPTKKQRKPYSVTDKKMMALEMAREKKNANHALRVKQRKLESAKLLLENELVQPKKIVKPVKQKIVQEESESEDEPQVIYIKKPKKKVPKKPIIIQEDETSSSGGSGSEEPESKPKSKSFGKSHKNKKSVVKIHKQESNPPQMVTRNYFWD